MGLLSIFSSTPSPVRNQQAVQGEQASQSKVKNAKNGNDKPNPVITSVDPKNAKKVDTATKAAIKIQDVKVAAKEETAHRAAEAVTDKITLSSSKAGKSELSDAVVSSLGIGYLVATGAKIGTAFGPVGTVAGAVAGFLIGVVVRVVVNKLVDQVANLAKKAVGKLKSFFGFGSKKA